MDSREGGPKGEGTTSIKETITKFLDGPELCIFWEHGKIQ